MDKPSRFDFWYAVNNTRVVLAPKRHLETFGNTLLHYHLVSEMMDEAGKVRVRTGRMQALKPQILMPNAYAKMALEGFGEEAEKYAEWLRQHESDMYVVRYGYTLRQEAFSEQLITDSPEAVVERVKKDVEASGDTFGAVLWGVDQPWDVCLIRLFWLMVQNSAPANIREMAQQHLFEMRDGLPVLVRNEIEIAFSAAAKDRRYIPELGKLLKKHDVFEQFETRFFELVRGMG